jgi:DNA invertase Pin-like site-specific DNA recombinase
MLESRKAANMARIADQGIVWGAYARLSRKKPASRRGQRRGRYRNPDESVQRQIRLIREHAAERGLNLPDHLIFYDNGRSGWQKPGGPAPVRPDWDRMIAAGEAGAFGGLLTWKLDRFARNVRDGEDLLDLGVLLDGPDSGRIDLRTAHGMSTFRRQIEAATHFSNETSEKVKAAFADMRANGYRIGGSGRLFGFEILSLAEVGDGYGGEDEDGEPGLLTGPAAVVREDEAEVIRDLARRLLAGETVQSMARDLNARHITTTRGGEWNARNLSRTLGNPLYGGRLAYGGEVIGELANVEPILDNGTYEAVKAKLDKRKRGRRVTGRYPLSGVAECGNPACARRTMAGYPRTGGKRAYVCAPANGGCGQSVLAAPVEAIVRDKVLAALADAQALEAMRAADVWLDAQREKLAGVLADLDADMAETEAKRAAAPRSMTRLRGQYDRNLASMAARYEAAERELAGLGPASAPAPPLPVMTAEDWDAPTTTAARKAAVIRRLGLRVTILPGTRRQGASRLPFDAGRVDVAFRD